MVKAVSAITSQLQFNQSPTGCKTVPVSVCEEGFTCLELLIFLYQHKMCHNKMLGVAGWTISQHIASKSANHDKIKIIIMAHSYTMTKVD